MDNYILLTALIVAMLSLVVAGIVYMRYRRMKRKKNRKILHHIRIQDNLAKELERAVIEKDTLRELLKAESGVNMREPITEDKAQKNDPHRDRHPGRQYIDDN